MPYYAFWVYGSSHYVRKNLMMRFLSMITKGLWRILCFLVRLKSGCCPGFDMFSIAYVQKQEKR